MLSQRGTPGADGKNWTTRAAEELVKVGNDSPEYHLFAGKYHLNLAGVRSRPLREFEAAAKAESQASVRPLQPGNGVPEASRIIREPADEFLKDAAVEPDLALNYEQLGEVYWQTQDDSNAEKSYREALRRDPRLASACLGLAKIYQRRQKYAAALAETDAALKADPARTDAHYMRGQVLLHLGRKEEAKKEMAAAGGSGERPANARVPSPELLQDSQ